MAVVGKIGPGERTFRAINVGIMLFICFVTLYPFLNILAISFSGKGPVARGEVTFYPKQFTPMAYEKIIESGAVFRAYKNTLFVVIMGTFFSVLLTSFAAYPLSKSQLVGRVPITFFIAMTLWFSAGMIPTFLLVKNLGLLDSLWALIVAPLISAYHVVIMRTFFMNIPDSLEESAKLDGCNDAVVLFLIVMPLSKPVLATVALWVAVHHWNSFFDPLIFLQTRAKFTLQIVLRDIVLANATQEYGVDVDPNSDEFAVVSDSVRYGTIMVATFPILCVYPFLQKYFVRGVLIGSIKG